ncbi:MAG: TetR/AcrR family transcriptional regulator [Planctomycetota bacterium]
MSSAQRGRPREFDTEAALDAAVMVFWKQGYEGTGVAELCEAMGIAKQSMYDWVGDKRGLYIAAIERYKLTHICGLKGHLTAPGSPLGNLWHCLHAMAEYAKSPDCMGCLLTNAESEFGTSDPEVARLTADIESYIVDQFSQVLDRAKAAGEVPETLDTKAMGGALAVFRNGIMVAGRSGQSASSIDQTIQLIEGLLKAG